MWTNECNANSDIYIYIYVWICIAFVCSHPLLSFVESLCICICICFLRKHFLCVYVCLSVVVHLFVYLCVYMFVCLYVLYFMTEEVACSLNLNLKRGDCMNKWVKDRRCIREAHGNDRLVMKITHVVKDAVNCDEQTSPRSVTCRWPGLNLKQ